MRLLKQAMAVVGTVTMIAVLMAFVAPRSAHAVVAALVQIVPGTTTHVGQNESQLVYLSCHPGSSNCVSVDPKAVESTTAYVVPQGYTLVVTDYSWSAFGVVGISAGVLRTDELFNSSNSQPFAFSNALSDQVGAAAAHEHYATGIRVGSGVTLEDAIAENSQGGSSILGYLVPND